MQHFFWKYLQQKRVEASGWARNDTQLARAPGNSFANDHTSSNCKFMIRPLWGLGRQHLAHVTTVLLSSVKGLNSFQLLILCRYEQPQIWQITKTRSLTHWILTGCGRLASYTIASFDSLVCDLKLRREQPFRCSASALSSSHTRWQSTFFSFSFFPRLLLHCGIKGHSSQVYESMLD